MTDKVVSSSRCVPYDVLADAVDFAYAHNFDLWSAIAESDTSSSGLWLDVVAAAKTHWYENLSLDTQILHECIALTYGGWSFAQGIPRLLARSLQFDNCREVFLHSPPMDVYEMLTGLENLRRLNVSRGKEGTLPAVGLLTGLEKLSLINCAHNPCDTKPTDDLFGSGLCHLTSLTQLRHLDLFSCHWVTSLEPLAELPALTHLDLSECVGLRGCPFAPLAQLPELQHLVLAGNPDLQEAAMVQIGACHNLRVLDLSWCRNWVTTASIVGLSTLHRMQQLNLRCCAKVSSLAPLSSMPELKKVEMPALRSLPSDALAPLAKTTSLVDINLCTTNDIDLMPLTSHTKLETVSLMGSGITAATLAALPRMKSLRELNLAGCAELDRDAFAHIALVPSLTDLDLRGQPLDRIEKWAIFSRLPRLRKLNISNGSVANETLMGLSSCKELRHLSMCGNTGITSIAPLASCIALTSLECSNCSTLAGDDALRPLAQLTNLRELQLCFCDGISDTSLLALTGLKQLEKVDLGGCSAVTEDGVAELQRELFDTKVDCRHPFQRYTANRDIS